MYIYIYRAFICNPAHEPHHPAQIGTHSFLVRARIRSERVSLRRWIRNEKRGALGPRLGPELMAWAPDSWLGSWTEVQAMCLG